MTPDLPVGEAIFEVEPPIAYLTFNRPKARNAMTWGMYDALVEACNQADGNERVRVLVLRGSGGRAFAAGTDISQFQSFQTEEDGVRYEQRVSDVLDRLEQVTKPTIAQIEGVAAGAGCVIAVTCDLRVASVESTFGVPIARTLGNCLSGGGFSRVVELVGPGHARDMLLTGRLIDAEEAQAIGLVNRVVPAAALDAHVKDLARVLASNAPLTLQATKEMYRRLAARRRLTAEETRDLVARCYASADFREGVAAFLGKRPARWTGQ
jgi:enoyl-CoA hydratase/carnithine racemase